MATWQDKLKDYSTNQDAAINELIRAKQMYNAEKATGAGLDRLNQISHWADQVRTAGGLDPSQYGSSVSLQGVQDSLNRYKQNQQTSQYQNQANSLLNKAQGAINEGFRYDPEDDPRYQAAKELAKRNAQTASNQAMATLNDRGILNSTITSDRLGQIEQQYADSVDQMIPQLYQNAYNEYQGNIGNLMDIANTLAQRTQFQQGQDQQRELAMLPYQQLTKGQQAEETWRQKQWAASPESQSWYLPAQKQLMQAQIANTNRSANAPYSTSKTSTPKPTQTERQNQATAEAMQAVDKALKGGASPEQVRASIVAQTPQLIADGVDPTEIDSYLTTVSTTMQKTQQDTEKQRLQQRPFWQKGIDAILPWGQFR